MTYFRTYTPGGLCVCWRAAVNWWWSLVLKIPLLRPGTQEFRSGSRMEMNLIGELLVDRIGRKATGQRERIVLTFLKNKVLVFKKEFEICYEI